MPRVTAQTRKAHSELPSDVALSESQMQRAIEADLGPLADGAGHWRLYAALAAGASGRLPDHDDAAVLLAMGGLPTTRLSEAILRAWRTDYPVESPEELDVVFGRVVEDCSDSNVQFLLQNAHASGMELAEGVVVSVLGGLYRHLGLATDSAEPPPGEGLDDLAVDYASLLDNSFPVTGLEMRPAMRKLAAFMEVLRFFAGYALSKAEELVERATPFELVRAVLEAAPSVLSSVQVGKVGAAGTSELLGLIAYRAAALHALHETRILGRDSSGLPLHTLEELVDLANCPLPSASTLEAPHPRPGDLVGVLMNHFFNRSAQPNPAVARIVQALAPGNLA